MGGRKQKIPYFSSDDKNRFSISSSMSLLVLAMSEMRWWLLVKVGLLKSVIGDG